MRITNFFVQKIQITCCERFRKIEYQDMTQTTPFETLKETLKFVDDEQLKELGLVKEETVAERPKIELNLAPGKFILFRRKTKHDYSDHVKGIADPTQLKPQDFADYEKENPFTLYQKVSATELKKINPKLYNAHKKALKEAALLRKKKKAAAEKRRIARENKKLERARKLLAEHKAHEKS